MEYRHNKIGQQMVFTLVWCAAMTLTETGLMNIDEHGVNMTPQQLCINSIKIEVKYFSMCDYFLKRCLRINNYVNMKLF